MLVSMHKWDFFFFPDEDDEADEDGVKINSLYTQKQMHGKQSIKN